MVARSKIYGFFLGIAISTSSFAMDVPALDTRNEIEQQLLEIAVANVSSTYAELYDQLISNRNSPSYGELLAKSYGCLKFFRNSTAYISWTDRQNFSFNNKEVQCEGHKNEYEQYLHSGELAYEVMNLRPPVPQYLKYRKALIDALKIKPLETEPYSFQVLKPEESTGDAVNVLKRTLKEIKYLDDTVLEDGFYDSVTAEAVSKFQEDNHLTVDGIVGYRTYEALYQPRDYVAVSIARTMIRLADRSLTQGISYIFVNIPDMNLHLYNEGVSVLDSRVIVGRKDRQTPRLHSIVGSVVLNPSWTAPGTIKEKDYGPKVLKDPSYFSKHSMKIYTPDGVLIDPALIPLNDAKRGLPGYRIVQDPGNGNALGRYKFNFPNVDSVYLHSTNSPSLFTRTGRALSSGCVRVEKSKSLAEYLLKGTSYNKERIEKAIEKGNTQWVTLNMKIPVYIAYLTSYIGQNGAVYTYPDIYGIDSKNSKVSKHIMKYFSEEL